MFSERKLCMHKKAVTLIALWLALILLSASALAQAFPTYAVYDQPLFPDVNPSYHIRVAYLDPANPFQANEHGMCVVFKNLVERTTQGDVFVECFPGGAMGSERDFIELARAGAIQAFIVAEGIVPTFYPPVQVLATPYVFRDHAHAYRVLDGPFGEAMAQDILEQSDFRVLAFGENGGFRNFTSGRRVMREPEDIQGQSFRTMDHPGHMAIVEALGGSPTPIPWLEVYTALQTGVVDGQENPVPVINFGRIYEVQDYLILDGHVYSIDFFFMPESYFQTLPEAYQDLVLLGGYQATMVSRGINRILEWEALARWEAEDAFVEIVVPTPETRVEFAELTQGPFLEWYHSQVDPEGVWSERLFQAVEEAETHFSPNR